MKKLTLNKTNFAGAELLSRDQLKRILGGDSIASLPDCSRGKCKQGYTCQVPAAQTKCGCVSEDRWSSGGCGF